MAVPPFGFLCGLLFFLPLSSAVACYGEIIGDIDDANGFVVDINLLPPVSAAFVGSVYNDFVNQVVDNLRSQFCRIGVLAYIL